MRNETLYDLIGTYGGLKEIAAMAGVGRTSIWRWCNGLSTPLLPQATSLATALDVTVERVLRAADHARRSRDDTAAPV